MQANADRLKPRHRFATAAVMATSLAFTVSALPSVAWSQALDQAPSDRDVIDAGAAPSTDTSTAPQPAEPGFIDQILALIGAGSASSETGDAGADTEDDSAPTDLARDHSEVEAAPVRAVELLVPADERSILQRNFFGRVVARDTANLAFPLSGTLTRFPVDEGAILEAGTTLAQLDLAPFERAVERAELQLEQAERAHARASRLEERNVGPRTQAEDTQTALDLADVALREARDALEDATITAPYRALIAERMTANYVIVEPGMPVVRVHDISQMRVEIDIPERLMRHQSQLEVVTFTAQLPGQDTPATLPVVEFQAQTEAVGQTYRVSLALPEGAANLVLPGNSLTVTASLPNPSPNLTIPSTAITADAERSPYVMVFEPTGAMEGVVHARPVTVASVNGTDFTVDGLSQDAEIVAIGAHLLREGQRVRRYTGLKSGE